MNPKNMTVSGLERYVRIVETVRQTHHRMSLSPADHWDIINELLDSDKNPTFEEIEKYCDDYAENVSCKNMARASWMRRGGF